MPLFPLLFSPIGRWLTIGVCLMMVCVGAYLKIQKDAADRVITRQQMQDMKRLQNALDADERTRRLLADPDGLRANVGLRRD